MLPHPHCQPQSSPATPSTLPLHQGCSCSQCSWKCRLQLDGSDRPPDMLRWTEGPKRTYPQEEAQSLGAAQAVAEGYEEGAVRGKDPHPARAAAPDRPACPGPTGFTGHHRKRQHPTEQWDIPSAAGRRDRWHLAKETGCSGGRGSLWARRQTEHWTRLVLPGVEGEGTVPDPEPPTNASAQPPTEGLISATPRGQGEIRPIDAGLADNHQPSRQQPRWCHVLGLQLGPTPPLPSWGEAVPEHPGMQGGISASSPPLQRINLIATSGGR